MIQLDKGVSLIAATVLMLVIGYTTVHTTDIASLKGHEDFEWNGRAIFLDTRGERSHSSILTKIAT